MSFPARARSAQAMRTQGNHLALCHRFVRPPSHRISSKHLAHPGLILAFHEAPMDEACCNMPQHLFLGGRLKIWLGFLGDKTLDQNLNPVAKHVFLKDGE